MGRCARIVTAALFLASATRALADDAALVSAAQKEGRVTWYTTQIVDQLAKPMALAFEKRYGVHVDYVRADPGDIVLRITAEARAGHMQADVFDGTSTAPSLKKAGFALRWQPEEAQRLPKRFVDPAGVWVATNLYVLTPAFNTDLVATGTEPKTFDDLLAPQWKDKMVWSRSRAASAAPGFIGLVLADRGLEAGMDYLKSLAKQNIAGVDAAARQVLDQVAAGEYAVGLATFDNHAQISAAKGAPVDWIPMNPAMAVLSVTGVAKDAPHPNAAKLFATFLTSEEGQTIFRNADYLPVDPQVKAKDERLRPDGERFRAIYFTPEEIEDAMPRWVDIQNRPLPMTERTVSPIFRMENVMTRLLHFARMVAGGVLAFGAATRSYAADEATVAAARKEGQVVWYTTLIVNQAVLPLKTAFERKYPGVVLNYVRNDEGPTAIRLSNESRGGQVMADVFDGLSIMEPLRREELIAPYVPPNADQFDPARRDKDAYWNAILLYVFAACSNTDLVTQAQAPKNYADLLDASLRGKMAWNPNSVAGAIGFAGAALLRMGEKDGATYLKALAQQKIANVDASSRAILDQVITGEYPLMLMCFNNHAVISADKGAPTTWLKIAPAPVAFDAVSLMKGAPHPAAARLLLEFLTSEEGQTVLRNANYTPAMKGVSAKSPGLKPEDGGFAATYLYPAEIDRNLPKWQGIVNDLFR